MILRIFESCADMDAYAARLGCLAGCAIMECGHYGKGAFDAGMTLSALGSGGAKLLLVKDLSLACRRMEGSPGLMSRFADEAVKHGIDVEFLECDMGTFYGRADYFITEARANGIDVITDAVMDIQ